MVGHLELRPKLVLRTEAGDIEIGLVVGVAGRHDGEYREIDVLLTIGIEGQPNTVDTAYGRRVPVNTEVHLRDAQAAEVNKAREDGAKAERARLAQKIAEALR